MEHLKIFAKTVEEVAYRQIFGMSESEAYKDCLVRIMPDCHAGTGCIVGTVIKVGERVVPNTVGVDIGCGMLVAVFKNLELDLERLDEVANTLVPSGFDIHETPVVEFEPLQHLYSNAAVDINLAQRAIGSLGGGNHFIEANRDDEGNTYIVIHSGSRNLGLRVCKYFQEMAVKDMRNISLKVREIIDRMKAEGREREISQAIAAIKKPEVEKELAFLQGEHLAQYLHDMDIAQEYARLNRETMLGIICSAMGITPDSTFQTIHNYIERNGEEVILRKGAVSAKAGETLIIPMNMRDGSLICVGKGNADWLCSAPHGAGRLMSRSAAHQAITLEQFEASMQGIYSTSVCAETIDESPMAYKPMQEIIDCVQPTVEIRKIIRPIYNFKAKGTVKMED
ncbi:MAG: RtcB family protein [Prevotella sp.]|nr:RtcB family protein [Prevotella sp.]